MTKTTAGLYAALTVLISGCSVYVRPPVVEVAPPPVVAVYPDYYAWDGFEYVGVRGGQYFYLGAGGGWVVADAVVLGRFHGWERYHADWRRNAIRFDRGHPPDHRGPAFEHRGPAGEHRPEDRKAPAPQHGKAPDPKQKKPAHPEDKKQP